MTKLNWDKKRREDLAHKEEDLSLSPIERSKLAARWRKAQRNKSRGGKIRKGGSKAV